MSPPKYCLLVFMIGGLAVTSVAALPPNTGPGPEVEEVIPEDITTPLRIGSGVFFNVSYNGLTPGDYVRLWSLDNDSSSQDYPEADNPIPGHSFNFSQEGENVSSQRAMDMMPNQSELDNRSVQDNPFNSSAAADIMDSYASNGGDSNMNAWNSLLLYLDGNDFSWRRPPDHGLNFRRTSVPYSGVGKHNYFAFQDQWTVQPTLDTAWHPTIYNDTSDDTQIQDTNSEGVVNNVSISLFSIDPLVEVHYAENESEFMLGREGMVNYYLDYRVRLPQNRTNSSQRRVFYEESQTAPGVEFVELQGINPNTTIRRWSDSPGGLYMWNAKQDLSHHSHSGSYELEDANKFDAIQLRTRINITYLKIVWTKNNTTNNRTWNVDLDSNESLSSASTSGNQVIAVISNGSESYTRTKTVHLSDLNVSADQGADRVKLIDFTLGSASVSGSNVNYKVNISYWNINQTRYNNVTRARSERIGGPVFAGNPTAEITRAELPESYQWKVNFNWSGPGTPHFIQNQIRLNDFKIQSRWKYFTHRDRDWDGVMMNYTDNDTIIAAPTREQADLSANPATLHAYPSGDYQVQGGELSPYSVENTTTFGPRYNSPHFSSRLNFSAVNYTQYDYFVLEWTNRDKVWENTNRRVNGSLEVDGEEVFNTSDSEWVNGSAPLESPSTAIAQEDIQILGPIPFQGAELESEGTVQVLNSNLNISILNKTDSHYNVRVELTSGSGSTSLPGVPIDTSRPERGHITINGHQIQPTNSSGISVVQVERGVSSSTLEAQYHPTPWYVLNRSTQPYMPSSDLVQTSEFAIFNIALNPTQVIPTLLLVVFLYLLTKMKPFNI